MNFEYAFFDVIGNEWAGKNNLDLSIIFIPAYNIHATGGFTQRMAGLDCAILSVIL